MKRSSTGFHAILLVLALLFLAACSAEEKPEAETAEADAPPGWPRELALDDATVPGRASGATVPGRASGATVPGRASGATVTVYEPQIESWVGYRELNFLAAVSVEAPEIEEPLVGALRIQARTETDLETRTVLIAGIEIAEARFPTLDEAASGEWKGRLDGLLRYAPQTIALDRVLAHYEHAGAEILPPTDAAPPSEIAADAPVLFVSQRPAVLVLLDGEPVLFPVEGTDLLFAVNTNWDLFFHSKSGRYFLLLEDAWLAAATLVGPWRPSQELPPDFQRLPEGEDWAEVRANVPGRRLGADQVPVVYTSTRPAELVLLDGAPALTPIEGTRLLWAGNTDSDLFFFGGDDRYYYLVSGRWFAAASLDGPWSFATPELPEDFSKIPPGHPRSSVLASVPGTPQAEEAVLLAQVPTQATVDRDTAAAEVRYEGDEPEFAAVEGTSVEYATNTSSDVLRVGDLYYLCLQGVWFVSASPQGPWKVADHVADEIYTIPASSPVHHTTYVTVYDSTPDTVVVGYTPGYLGLYVAWGCVVFGTGHYYPPYVYWGPRPVYHPYAYSYGAAAWYNPHTGMYGRSGVAYGPYGGVGRAAAYNPYTGTYARGAAAYGPYGGTAAAQAYNPRTGTYRAGYQSSNPYSHWGEQVVRRGDDWVRTGHYSDSRGTVAGYRTSDGRRGVVVATDHGTAVVGGRGNNVYVGQDGDVYRRGDNGWSKHDKNGWNRVAGSEAQADARSRAAQTDAAAARREQVERRAREGQGTQTADRAAAAQRAAPPAERSAAAGRPSPGQLSEAARQRSSAPGSTAGTGSTWGGTRDTESWGGPRGGTGSLGGPGGGSGSRGGPGGSRDVLNQLDRDARARSAGSSRVQSQRGSSSRAGAGRSGSGRSGSGRSGGRRGG